MFGLGLTLTVAPLDRHRPRRRGRAACRYRLGRQQRHLAGRGARRRRGDSGARRSDRRRLSGPGRLRERLSYRHADQRRVGRGRWGARVVARSATRSRVVQTRALRPGSIAGTTARSTARRWPPSATPRRRRVPPCDPLAPGVDQHRRRNPTPRELAALLQTHAARVVADGARPVGEDAEDADLPRQHVERRHDVAVVAERVERGLVVERGSWRCPWSAAPPRRCGPSARASR